MLKELQCLTLTYIILILWRTAHQFTKV